MTSKQAIHCLLDRGPARGFREQGNVIIYSEEYLVPLLLTKTVAKQFW